MKSCDVLIVGGGPAGSSCAWRLRQAGLDVIVMDRAGFPRDKVCAGWITPQVIEDLEIDCDDYRRGRTFQAITGFRTGVIGRTTEVETAYDRPVSFGIRRCEFDHYLLRRSEARLKLEMPLATLERHGTRWVVNGAVTTPMVVGAGGHFCLVARQLNPALERAPLVAAHEVELPLDADTAASWTTAPTMPELYFCRDLSGYGWCFRKGQYVNIGLGRFGRSLPSASGEFLGFLRNRRKIPAGASWRWRGHAYLVSDPPRRRTVDAGVMLIGDAAGLAYPQSGEGIRPAIESGLLAASTLIEARGCYTRGRLVAYEQRLKERFGRSDSLSRPARSESSPLARAIVPWLLDVPSFVRHVVLDRWFLHAHERALARV